MDPFSLWTAYLLRLVYFGSILFLCDFNLFSKYYEAPFETQYYALESNQCYCQNVFTGFVIHKSSIEARYFFKF